MRKLLNLKNLIALILIGVVFVDYLPAINLVPKPNVAILDIDKPTDSIVKAVTPIADLVTDPNDRAKLAIYSQEFANRIKSYDVDSQQVNDILTESAKEFFQGSITDKYPNLDEKIIQLIVSSIGDENHKLTESEKNDLSNNFMGLAWSLIQKR